MDQMPFARRIQHMLEIAGPVIDFVTDPRWEEMRKNPDCADFLVGNPQNFPLEGITTALQKWAVPQNKDWFAYKMSESQSQQVISTSLRQSHQLPFEPQDIFMTTGAFAAISATLSLIIDPGDEILYISPPWFFYEMMIASYYGTPVRVPCDPTTFDLDLPAIRRAITPRTRGIIVNSPNNPTGRIYPPETLRQLSTMLTQASQENGRSIYLISDEAYRNIRFDGNSYHSPAAYYRNTFVIYTYGKTLLAPGQRLGYIALPPAMPDRDLLRPALTSAIVAAGFTFPNALLQHALADLEKLSIDITRLQARRDRMVSALTRMGYSLSTPEGTFYLLVRSPIPDDMAFIDLLARHNIICLPGMMFEMPGYFRISLTASDAMVEKSLPGFEKAIAEAGTRTGVAPGSFGRSEPLS